MEIDIELKLAKAEDAELLHKLQVEAFLPLYEKYHDEDTSPAKETLERVKEKITEENSKFYLIYLGDEAVGGIRMRSHHRGQKLDNMNWISPLFILPDFQNKGIAQKVIQKVFEMYPETICWKLETIKEEKGNCYLYEKIGFVRCGTEFVVNERMTLVEYEKTM